ncbi:MAG: Selenide, water dikinase [candidate division TA06 bacterium ADurb.Bin131]|uniref:Selenide, water dikinase n=1 Tax=candidate division TA06 bacterium ADurb.Bin131 TaxID=1852827 RepID=A0A1V6CA58_UNCT6|nr:MAG: Selenide, water dikinase [candidate division TA06 bacterium ADurb.Bin131]
MVGEKMSGIKQEKDIKEGDSLLLVKEVGIEGSSILARKNASVRRKFPELAKKAFEAIKKPGISVVNEAITAWKTVPVIRMHDPTEGGLTSGIVELAEILQCGFIIEEEKIKIYKPAKVFCDYLGIDIYGLISSGCLLVVVPQNYAANLVSVYKNKKVPVSIIGVATKEKKVLLKRKDNSIREFSFAQDQIIGV